MAETEETISCLYTALTAEDTRIELKSNQKIKKNFPTSLMQTGAYSTVKKGKKVANNVRS